MDEEIIPSHAAIRQSYEINSAVTRPRMHSTPADTRQSLNRAYPEGEFPMHSQGNEIDFGCDYRDSRTRPRRSRSTPEHGQHQNPAVISDPSGDSYQISNKLERRHLPEGGTRSSRKERADPRPPGSSTEVAYEPEGLCCLELIVSEILKIILFLSANSITLFQ